ncbi:MAG: hypothetical protein M9925_14445 [Chloroflexi bacterium]|nr:hypothetical protein [Dehalococcoidia bacterium]MCO5202893.1 hypothetical protein [Chloroflexota bacterium]
MSERWQRGLDAARLAVGPLALAAFFLPWAHGPGPLAATEFTGYRLVGYAGRLQALDFSVSQGAVLWSVRMVILAVAVAATWQTLLAPRHRSNPVYPISGWYLVALAGVALGIGVARAGVVVPPPGLLLLGLAGALFTAAELTRARSSSGSTQAETPDASAR